MGKKDHSASSALEWRKETEEARRGYVVTLPLSGRKVRLRSISLERLLRSGEIPDLLTPMAAKALWTETDTAEIGSAVKTAVEWLDFVNLVCELAMVEPKFSATPTDDKDTIGIDDISLDDRFSVFQLSIQPSVVLRKFRDEQISSMAGVPDGQNDGDEGK